MESNQKKRKKIKLFDPVCFGSAQEQEMVYKNLSKNNKIRGEELFKSKKKKKKNKKSNDVECFMRVSNKESYLGIIVIASSH